MRETMTKLGLASAALEKLTAETPAQWGNMTAQHMVEHLIDSVRLANGKFSAPFLFGEEKAAEMKERFAQYIADPGIFPKNVPNPLVKLGPYKAASLAVAIEKLAADVELFYAHFAQNPDVRPTHPFFGPLNFEEWEAFHEKHFRHHFTQFELL